MLNISALKEGQFIRYIGDSWTFGGTYKLYRYETSFINPDECPDEDRDSLFIHVESGDWFLFYLVRLLRPDEWELID